MSHILELFVWFFSQRAVMLFSFIPFAAIVMMGSIVLTVRRF